MDERYKRIVNVNKSELASTIFGKNIVRIIESNYGGNYRIGYVDSKTGKRFGETLLTLRKKPKNEQSYILKKINKPQLGITAESKSYIIGIEAKNRNDLLRKLRSITNYFTFDDFKKGLNTGVSAVAAGNIFNFTEHSYKFAKKELKDENFNVR